eukprot:905889_1
MADNSEWEYILIFGYTRLIEDNHNVSQSTPDAVIQIIYSFYPKMTTIIIKNGSNRMKNGFSSDQKPQSIFPTIVGCRRHSNVCLPQPKRHPTVGHEANRFRGRHTIRHPIKRGIITDFHDMQYNIWDVLMNDELKIDKEELKCMNVLLTETHLNTKENREKMTQIMLEHFNVNGVCIANESVLSLYAVGKTTGVVLHCGQYMYHSVPIHQGHCVSNAVITMDLNMDEYFCRILTERGYSFTTRAEKIIVQNIKEKLCYVAMDFDAEMEIYETSSELERNYELPDGYAITIGNERMRAPEILFSHSSGKSVDECLVDSIKKCDDMNVKDLFGNIVLSGGNSSFDGMKQRLEKEMKKRVNCDVNVIDPPDKHSLSWIGGSLLARSQSFGEMLITRDLYNEHGPKIVHQKCN